MPYLVHQMMPASRMFFHNVFCCTRTIEFLIISETKTTYRAQREAEAITVHKSTIDANMDTLTPSTTPPQLAAGETLKPPVSCRFIKHLFGPKTPAVPVYGSSAAIDELNVAISRDGLFIQPQGTPEPSNNIKIAYQHLQQKGVFPQTEQLKVLHDTTMQGGEAMSVGMKDFDVSLPPEVTGSPPFKVLDIMRVLGTLRIVEKYYDEYVSQVLGDPETHAYQLGVITMTKRAGDGPSFNVQLFQSKADAEPTGTLWLYRWCIFNGVGGYDEQWRAVGDGKFDMKTLPETTPMVPELTAKFTKKRARDDTDRTDENIDPDNSPPVPSTHTQRPAKRHRQRRASIPDEQLFSHDPDNIRGEIILRLAHHYSNAELLDRINTGLAAKGLQRIKNANVITRRITIAIKAQADDDEKNVKIIRKSLNGARRANGVRERVNAMMQATKEKNRIAKAMAEGGAEDGDEDESEDE